MSSPTTPPDEPECVRRLEITTKDCEPDVPRYSPIAVEGLPDECPSDCLVSERYPTAHILIDAYAPVKQLTGFAI